MWKSSQQNSKGPSRDWLKIVKTAQAKAKIRQFYKKELKDQNIANGKQMLDYEAKRQAVSLPSLLKQGVSVDSAEILVCGFG